MYENYLNYEEEDIRSWLSNVQVEIQTSVGRLSAMDKATMTEAEIGDICQALLQAGCQKATFESFITSRHELPFAWSLSAVK